MKESRKYDGWLVSDSFIKRLMAICGYVFLGWIIFYMGLFILLFIAEMVIP